VSSREKKECSHADKLLRDAILQLKRIALEKDIAVTNGLYTEHSNPRKYRFILIIKPYYDLPPYRQCVDIGQCANRAFPASIIFYVPSAVY
jgi:hypothetical protein